MYAGEKTNGRTAYSSFLSLSLFCAIKPQRDLRLRAKKSVTRHEKTEKYALLLCSYNFKDIIVHVYFVLP